MSERLRVARDGLVIYLGIRVWWDGKCLLPEESDKLWAQVQNYPFQKKKGEDLFIWAQNPISTLPPSSKKFPPFGFHLIRRV